MTRHGDREWLYLLIVLAVGGMLLLVTIVPGVFTIDEANHLALTLSVSAGGFTVPGTGGLPPSRELRYFDPALRTRAVRTTPVASVAPPLYAFFALPFSSFGWRGLATLNTLAFLMSAAIVFLYTRDFATRRSSPWLAVGAFSIGGYLLEYAQGVWPHMLSAYLCVVGVYSTSWASRRGPWPFALVAGLVLGTAAGVRYQNILFVASMGLALSAWSRPRARMLPAYGAGLLLPLALCSVINHSRADSWHPFSKGPGYLTVGAGRTNESGTSEGRAGSGTLGSLDATLREAGLLFATRVVDSSWHPPLTPSSSFFHPYFERDPATGAVLVGRTLKKSWLQSSPWIVIPLLTLASGWVSRRTASDARRRELRTFSLVTAFVLGAFSLAGFDRTDGFCFNQRYFIELMPLMAITLAWSVEAIDFRGRWFVVGGSVSLAALAIFLTREPPFRYWALLKTPLVLSALSGAVWLASSRIRHGAIGLSLALGTGLAWAFGVHFWDDLAASRDIRRSNQLEMNQVDAVLPRHSALFAYWGRKDPFAPIQLRKDVLILDPWADRGASAPRLVRALFERRRRVLVRTDDLPPTILEAMSRGLRVERVDIESSEAAADSVQLVELVPDITHSPERRNR